MWMGARMHPCTAWMEMLRWLTTAMFTWAAHPTDDTLTAQLIFSELHKELCRTPLRPLRNFMRGSSTVRFCETSPDANQPERAELRAQSRSWINPFVP